MRDDLTPATLTLDGVDSKKILDHISDQTRLGMYSRSKITVPDSTARIQYKGSILEDQTRDIAETIIPQMQVQIDALKNNVENTKNIADDAKKTSALMEAQLNQYLIELEQAKSDSIKAKKQVLCSNIISFISLAVAILTLIATIVVPFIIEFSK